MRESETKDKSEGSKVISGRTSYGYESLKLTVNGKEKEVVE